MSEYLTIQERCHDCAFREGTEASRSEITQIKARLCLETMEPFNCHVAPAAICKGWADAAETRLKRGILPVDGDRREVLEAFNEAIVELEDRHVESQRADIERRHAAAIAELGL